MPLNMGKCPFEGCETTVFYRLVTVKDEITKERKETIRFEKEYLSLDAVQLPRSFVDESATAQRGDDRVAYRGNPSFVRYTTYVTVAMTILWFANSFFYVLLGSAAIGAALYFEPRVIDVFTRALNAFESIANITPGPQQ